MYIILSFMLIFFIRFVARIYDQNYIYNVSEVRTSETVLLEGDIERSLN